jgi:hypothetical protein
LPNLLEEGRGDQKMGQQAKHLGEEVRRAEPSEGAGDGLEGELGPDALAELDEHWLDRLEVQLLLGRDELGRDSEQGEHNALVVALVEVEFEEDFHDVGLPFHHF